MKIKNMLRALPKPKLWLIACGAVLLSSCAQIVSPSGGPRDTEPPVVVSQNFQDSSIRFDLGELEFRFNEVIGADMAKNAVEFSPFTNEDVDVHIVSKKVQIKIPQGALDPNTTYSMSLVGIKDVTEQNQLAPRTFIFSTGDYIDSLTIVGTVLRSENSRPDSSVSVLLYSADDSIRVVSSAKPKYYAPVKLDGSFMISALPPGNYRVYALSDQNRNFRYDLPVERFAFDTTVYHVSASKSLNIKLYTWSEVKDEKETSTSSGGRGGKQVQSNKLPDGYSFGIDTASLEPTQDLNSGLVLISGAGFDTFDVSLMSLTDTTTKETLEVEAILDSSRHRLFISPVTGWYSAHGYRMFMRESAVVDSNNLDFKTTSFYFSTVNREDYGSVLIHFIPPDSSAQYLVHLEYGSRERNVTVNNSLGFDIEIPEILESEITVSYFEDRNRNGVYDTGDFGRYLQPEIRFVHDEKYKVKKGWDHIYTLTALASGEEAKNSASVSSRGGQ